MMKAVLLVSVGAVAASCLASAASNLPPLRADRWVNSPLLSAEALHGKVVLVDFWEYTCVNWIRTSSYVKAWNQAYAPLGLVVIGVHAPEFEFGQQH
jgi:thiol-disulfide isomerase/thioredoxin